MSLDRMAAAEHVADKAPTANEYIVHHLTFLQNQEAHGIVDFRVIHWDSVFFSLLLAVVFAASFYIAARSSARRAGVPRGFQSFVEVLVAKVDETVREGFSGV